MLAVPVVLAVKDSTAPEAASETRFPLPPLMTLVSREVIVLVVSPCPKDVL